MSGADGKIYAVWQDLNGLAWSPFRGAFATLEDAKASCAAIGAELPKVDDINTGIVNNFEEVIPFDGAPLAYSLVGNVKGDAEDKVYWMNDSMPCYTGTCGTVFTVQKDFPVQGGIEHDSKDSFHKTLDFYPKPYGAFCVWRNVTAK